MWRGTDRPGRDLINLINATPLSLTNDFPQRTGKWTWLNGSRKTTVDFVLAFNNTTHRLKEITVDELWNKWGIGARQWVDKNSSRCATTQSQQKM